MVSSVSTSEEVPDGVPVIDMAMEDATVAAKLFSALTTVGFATLVNHRLSKSLREKTYAASRAFFSLPEEEKLKCAYQGHKANCGFIACGKEKHDDSLVADFKETYDINPDPRSQPWPDVVAEGSLATFQEDLMTYFDTMDQLHLRLLRLIALGLKLPSEYFVERCNERHENLRLLHYPEIAARSDANCSSNNNGISTKDEPIVRGHIHTDYGTITLLTQDDVGGLRVKTLDGKWIPVQPVEDSIVVNVGDMLQRWTNDVLKANPHQVVDLGAKAKDDKIPERYSIAFFCNANKTTMLECLEQCVSEDRPAKYEPITAFDYITKRLSATVQHEDIDV